MDSKSSREEMNTMKNFSPPPWLDDHLRKSNQIQQEILQKIIIYEDRTKSLENTIFQYKDTVTRQESTILKYENIMAKQEDEIERLNIQVYRLKTKLELQISRQIPSREETSSYYSSKWREPRPLLQSEDMQAETSRNFYEKQVRKNSADSTAPHDNQRNPPPNICHLEGNVMGPKFHPLQHKRRSPQEEYDQENSDFLKARQNMMQPTTSQSTESSVLQPEKINKRIPSYQAEVKSCTEPAISVSRSDTRLSQVYHHGQHDRQPSSLMQENKTLSPTTSTNTEEKIKKKQQPQVQNSPKSSDQQENKMRLRSEAKPQPTMPGQYCVHWEDSYGSLKLTSDYLIDGPSKHL